MICRSGLPAASGVVPRAGRTSNPHACSFPGDGAESMSHLARVTLCYPNCSVVQGCDPRPGRGQAVDKVVVPGHFRTPLLVLTPWWGQRRSNVQAVIRFRNVFPGRESFDDSLVEPPWIWNNFSAHFSIPVLLVLQITRWQAKIFLREKRC